MDQQKVFCDAFERKQAFLDYKKISLKNPKIYIFPKGLFNGFCERMEI